MAGAKAAGAAPRKVVTNSEGIEIPQQASLRERLRDRITFTLIGILNLIAVAVIAKQLKSFGLLPQYLDTDFTSVRAPCRGQCSAHRLAFQGSNT